MANQEMDKEYPDIDMKKTGLRIQNAVKEAGYSAQEIQRYLHLSCPQPVYRWFKGQILPSLNHLYALSVLLHVHMEDLIVDKNNNEKIWKTGEEVQCRDQKQMQRCLVYFRKLNKSA
ncbi:MAG: helix-turn-helix domain-containing protein [Lachnospiraceae bacterium]|nr:helix-turn-helix domain-containing protein [Lachnospiraceae bacterium]